MIALNILLGIIAGIAFLFVLGGLVDSQMSKDRHRNVTIAFVAILAFILALNIIK